MRSSVASVELDDTVTLAGAEGIDLDLVLAGIGSRSAALLIDLVVQTLPLIVVAFVARQFANAGVALVAITAFLVLFGYPTLMEAFAGGRTLGKMALGIAVVAADGTPVTFVAATIRNVVRVIDLLPGVYTVGLVAVLATRRSQRLGDLAAGTLVVRRARAQSGVGGPVPYAAGWDGAPPQPSAEIASWDTSALSLDEVAAVRAFLGRRQSLDAAHRSQIADTLARQILPKVAGIPLDGGPELLLERIAYARAFR